MAEKRFQWVYIKDELVQLRDNGVVKIYPNERLEELLNDLNDDNKRLIKMLDNVANYMQKQHKEVPIDDFVEWWNKIAIGGKDE